MSHCNSKAALRERNFYKLCVTGGRSLNSQDETTGQRIFLVAALLTTLCAAECGRRGRHTVRSKVLAKRSTDAMADAALQEKFKSIGLAEPTAKYGLQCLHCRSLHSAYNACKACVFFGPVPSPACYGMQGLTSVLHAAGLQSKTRSSKASWKL